MKRFRPIKPELQRQFIRRGICPLCQFTLELDYDAHFPKCLAERNLGVYFWWLPDRCACCGKPCDVIHRPGERVLEVFCSDACLVASTLLRERVGEVEDGLDHGI